MRFQKLTIHNLASIEDAVIDFEAQPLADSEVFLITGKTGAGKSTLLDAICLALYADTPRLDGTKMQGDFKDGEKNIKIDDPRQLMRRNTGEAWVILTFTGSNGIPYEATWSVQRARKKATGNIQEKNWQLTNLQTHHTLTKNKEIEAEIKAAIGIDFNQFCRTTLLAQGEFTRFLNSKDDEKAEILEKITGVDSYSKIGAKVFEITQQKKQCWEEAQRQVEGMQTLSEETIQAKKNALMVLDTTLEKLKKDKEKEVEKRTWILTEENLRDSRIKAMEAYQQVFDATQSEDFKQQESLIKDWKDTLEVRGWISELSKNEAEQKRQQEALEKLIERYIALLNGQLYAHQRQQELQDKLEQVEEFLQKESPRAVIYEQAQTIASQLTAIAEGQRLILGEVANIQEEQKRLTKELVPQQIQAQRAVETAQREMDWLAQDIQTQEKVLNELKLPELRVQREATQQLLNDLNLAKDRLHTWQEVYAQQEKIRQQLAIRQTGLEEKKKTLETLKTPLREAKLKRDVRLEDLDKQKDTIDKFAKTLRLKLHPGDICPVCRQTITHEWPHEEALSALVAQLQEAFEQADKEYQTGRDQFIKLEAEIASETHAYERDWKAFEQDTTVTVAYEKALDACKKCQIASLDALTFISLQQSEKHAQAYGQTLEVQLQQGEAQELKVKHTRTQLESKRRERDQLQLVLQQQETMIHACEARLQTAQALIQSKQQEVTTAENWLTNQLGKESAEQQWLTNPRAFATQLTTAATCYNQALQKKQALTTSLETAQTHAKNMQHLLETILQAMPAWRQCQASQPQEMEYLERQANAVNIEVASTLTRLHTAEKASSQYQQAIDNFLASPTAVDHRRLLELSRYTTNQITQWEGYLEQAHRQVVAQKTLLNSASEKYTEHLKGKPTLTDNDELGMLDARIQEAEQKIGEIGEEKGAIHQELKIDAENKLRLGTWIEKAQAKKATYENWSRMNQLIGDATGHKFRKIAQSYVLNSLIQAANSYLKSLTDRYTLQVTPGTFVISLEDAYQGFVRRTASTLSGGESFLVSLSLALALSDIGQPLKVDTLFIDEGFGTLSGEPLQNAIQTLQSLHQKAGRHVGIISHVEELRERIPVQIILEQKGHHSSSTVRIIDFSKP